MSKKSSQKGWNSEAGYIWSMIGSAVGFANILSFGAKSYQNGGGVFLIPLLVAFLLLGLPMLILEGIVGKTHHAPLVTSFGKVLGKRGKFLAWPTVFGVITIGGFYTVLNTWSLAYIWFSARGMIPVDTDAFFHQDFLGVTSSVSELGSFSYLIGFGSLALLVGVYKINSSPIADGIERLSKFFLPVLLGLLVLFLVGVLFLPGAIDGISYLTQFDFSLLKNSKIWLKAFGHVFFSLSIGLAIISGYSAYTDEKINIVRSMFYVVLGDLMTSFVSSMVIFGSLGYLAHLTGKPFADIVTSSSFGLGFVVFPKFFQSFSGITSMVVGTLFFFSLFLAGLTGLISIIEAAVGNVTREFSITRDKATLYVCLIVGILALGFSFGNGAHLMDVLDEMAAGVNVLLTGFLQIVLFLYVSKEFSKKEEWFKGKRKRFYFYSLKYLSPLLILLILCFRVSYELANDSGLELMIRWGWFALAILGSYFLSCRKSRS